VASLAVSRDVVEAIAQEMFAGVDRAVEGWMAEIETVLDSTRLTTLGKLLAISELVSHYKYSTGKRDLHKRAS
jgi:hypothetical protein